MTEQEIKDKEWADKYGIVHHRNIKPNTCPYCGGTDVYINDIVESDIGETAYFPMHCSDCDKNYQAYYKFSYALTNK